MALRAAGVTKSFGPRTAARAIDLTVAAGERVALIGGSGAGKSTLLRMFAALEWPDSGRIETLGRDVGTLRGRALRELRRDVGYLEQRDNLVPQLRVAHNVLMGRLGVWPTWKALLSLVAPQDLELAQRALERVELGARLWSLPGELSGGEQQRVAIARLVVQSPRVWLADEPTAGLDPRLGHSVLDLLLEAARERSATALVSLHDPDLLRGRFSRVVALRAGAVVYDGAPEHVDARVLREAYASEQSGEREA